MLHNGSNNLTIEDAMFVIKNAYWMVAFEDDGSQEAKDYRKAKQYLLNHGFTKEEIEELEEAY